MRIIHTADVHLDSPMRTNFTEEQAARRRAELVNTFRKMTEKAEEIGSAAVLIAGDLFDTDRVSRTSRGVVTEAIKGHPDVRFFYLRGNHDVDNSFGEMEELPENLYMFGKDWTSYRISGNGRDVVITGRELNGTESSDLAGELNLDPEDFNIVLLHGQVGSGASREPGIPVIDPGKYAGKNIDYMALGHIHSMQEGKIDVRGIWMYPGCLEGRGFDECGPKGFLELDIDEARRTFVARQIPFARRTFYAVRAELNGCMESIEAEKKARAAISESGAGTEDVVKLILSGEVEADSAFDRNYLQAALQDGTAFLKIVDETRPVIDYSVYANDRSLKGEFIRMVQKAEDLKEEEKAEVIRCGILALREEEVR